MGHIAAATLQSAPPRCANNELEGPFSTGLPPVAEHCCAGAGHQADPAYPPTEFGGASGGASTAIGAVPSLGGPVMVRRVTKTHNSSHKARQRLPATAALPTPKRSRV